MDSHHTSNLVHVWQLVRTAANANAENATCCGLRTSLEKAARKRIGLLSSSGRLDLCTIAAELQREIKDGRCSRQVLELILRVLLSCLNLESGQSELAAWARLYPKSQKVKIQRSTASTWPSPLRSNFQ